MLDYFSPWMLLYPFVTILCLGKAPFPGLGGCWWVLIFKPLSTTIRCCWHFISGIVKHYTCTIINGDCHHSVKLTDIFLEHAILSKQTLQSANFCQALLHSVTKPIKKLIFNFIIRFSHYLFQSKFNCEIDQPDCFTFDILIHSFRGTKHALYVVPLIIIIAVVSPKAKLLWPPYTSIKAINFPFPVLLYYCILTLLYVM